MRVPARRHATYSRLAGVCVAATTLAPIAAHASQAFELSGGTMGSGGFAARNTGASAASTYFNPALLPRARQGLRVGVFVIDQDIKIALDSRPTGPVYISPDLETRASVGPDEGGQLFFESGRPVNTYDVPARVNEVAPSLPTIPFPTDWLENGIYKQRSVDGEITTEQQRAASPRGARSTGKESQVYTTIGLVSRVWDQYLVAGFYAAFPVGVLNAGRAFFNDEREQFFSNSLHPELYADRLQTTNLSIGVGSQLFDSLSLGVSYGIKVVNKAMAQTYVPDPNHLDETLLALTTEAESSFAPNFGIAYDPLDRLPLTATFHTVQRFDVSNTAENLLVSGANQDFPLNFTFSYYPWTAAAGATVDLISGPTPGSRFLSVTAAAEYQEWSGYVDRHRHTPRGDYKWEGIVKSVVGLRHSFGPDESFLDVYYLPSPVPDQTGRTNYVDNNRGGISGGYSRGFQAFGYQFEVGGQIQFHTLFQRSVEKIIPQNPGNPDTPTSDPASNLIVDEVQNASFVDRGERQALPGGDGLQTNNPGFPGFSSEGSVFGGGFHMSLFY